MTTLPSDLVRIVPDGSAARRRLNLSLCLFLLAFTTTPVLAADLYDAPPIEYSTAATDNAIARLEHQIAAGAARLEYTEPRGYLDALLAVLDVPPESQTLVFSKTSLQRDCISARTPRALYFGDDAYVGYCKSGQVLEIAVADAGLGTVFYTLDQRSRDKPAFVRETARCMQCHETSRTAGVPGLLARSMFVEESGQPIFSAGSYDVDYRTPFEERWGGWYVTGTHGDQKHLGNLVIDGPDVPRHVDNSAGQNLASLPERVAQAGYLTPHSDIVALLVLEHQMFVQNRITKASFNTRQALHSDAEMRRVFGDPPGPLRESTISRIHHAGDELVEALLFHKEAPLTAPIAGTSGFAATFTRRGKRDSQGRSLRDFDLNTRLFKYPCSYLIESEAFRALPEEVRNHVWRRLWQILVEGADADEFGYLTADDRQAVVEILQETQPELPAFWQPGASPLGNDAASDSRLQSVSRPR